MNAMRIRRRHFIMRVAGVTIAMFGASSGSRAQQTKMPVIGFLNGFSPVGWAQPVASFHKGLNESGYIEGQNVAIEYRWAEGQFDRLPALAAELVRRQVNVIVATGGSAIALSIPQSLSGRADEVIQ
ncbi:MAG: transporter substrate-binding protein [Bryobacterales bacterium]|nr:transporter substrate-binding protein [Bryobacterales bacterium]